MRQALAKGTRRELRRAMGVGALDHVHAQDQAVAILQNAVTNCQREIATLAVNHAEFKKATGERLERSRSNLGVAFTYIEELQRERTNRNALSFLGRLRWLFTGK